MVKAVSAAGAAIVAGVSVVAFPPAMIVLPVMFPLIILVSQGIEWKLAKQVQSELIYLSFSSHQEAELGFQSERKRRPAMKNRLLC